MQGARGVKGVRGITIAVVLADDKDGTTTLDDLSQLKIQLIGHHIVRRACDLGRLHQGQPLHLQVFYNRVHLDLAQLSTLRSEWSQLLLRLLFPALNGHLVNGHRH